MACKWGIAWYGPRLTLRRSRTLRSIFVVFSVIHYSSIRMESSCPGTCEALQLMWGGDGRGREIARKGCAYLHNTASLAVLKANNLLRNGVGNLKLETEEGSSKLL